MILQPENDPPLPIIPTSSRDALPGWLSYPIGAELISKALRDVPQFSDLLLSFSWYSNVAQNRKMRDGEPTEVVSLYTPDTSYSDFWHIWIYPVLSTSKSQARKLLLEEGLSLVRSWLESRAVDQEVSFHRLKIRFDPIECKITTEAYNQFTT